MRHTGSDGPPFTLITSQNVDCIREPSGRVPRPPQVITREPTRAEHTPLRCVPPATSVHVHRSVFAFQRRRLDCDFLPNAPLTMTASPAAVETQPKRVRRSGKSATRFHVRAGPNLVAMLAKTCAVKVLLSSSTPLPTKSSSKVVPTDGCLETVATLVRSGPPVRSVAAKHLFATDRTCGPLCKRF